MKTFILIPIVLHCLNAASQPIWVNTQGGELYSLDLANCSSRLISSTGHVFVDIAFTPDGRLWGLEESDLYQIDTITGGSILIGNIGLSSASSSLVGLNDSILLTEAGRKLYGINIFNPTAFYIDTIGFQALGDLTWYDDDLYMMAPGQLIKITLNNTNTAIVNVTPINELGDPIPDCFGTATASFAGDFNSIIGFSGTDALKICQLDGTYKTICSSMVPDMIYGGASIRLPVQQPPPTTCSASTSVANVIPNTTKMEIVPNPVSRSEQIQVKINGMILSSCTINIISLQGQVLYSSTEQSASSEFELDLSRINLTSGLYVVEVNNSYQQFHSLIVIE